ncbi:hypothetical protein ACFU5O_05240 [Streptomyces sp. NPDC057445]|uniref:hypothetical protein n=1 Tax=Streptomyces sp. NPDC057445 TaxID=3346136 RepID=UPI0036BAC3E9
MKQLMFHDDPPFWFETMRNLGLAVYGGSDVGDAIAHLPGITPVEIPYEDTVLRGYFYRAAGEGPKPALVMHNGFDGATEVSDPRKLYRHLTAPKTLLSFTEEEGGDAHCHPGALRLAVARIFDWLDNTI